MTFRAALVVISLCIAGVLGLIAYQWQAVQTIVRVTAGSPSLIDLNESELRASLMHPSSPTDKVRNTLRLARLLSLKGDHGGAIHLCQQIINAGEADHLSAEAVSQWVRSAEQAKLADADVRTFLASLSRTSSSHSRMVAGQAALEATLLGQSFGPNPATYERLQQVIERYRNTRAAELAKEHLIELLAKSLEEARALLGRREWKEALDIIMDAHGNPACDRSAIAVLSSLKGDAYAGLGHNELAIAGWRLALEQSPGMEARIDVTVKIGDACLRARDLRRAERWYRMLSLARTPLQQAIYHQRMGLLMQAQGRGDAAATEYRQAISACPEGEASRLARHALEGIRQDRDRTRWTF